MRFRHLAIAVAMLSFAILLLGVKAAQVPDTPADSNPPPAPAGTDVQARGPVHEAFAEPTVTVGVPGVVVSKEPPQSIEEMPPEAKPEGDHVVWIPGYWSWDTEANDFIWISGLWRAVPPNRTWNPGHWQQVNSGWQWVSGYWGDAEATETEYLPEPPESLDHGPSSPAPDETSSYVPGCWFYQTNRYMWRPGYWLAHRADWVWTPSCYRWTPAGYIYVNGFWDIPLLTRGLLFTPVRFQRSVYLAEGFTYQPSYVIQPDFLVSALFISTGRPCYYFGDYFEPRYRKTFVSWMDYRMNRTVYDANFSYYRASYARHPEWTRNLATLYKGRYEGTIARPPVSLAQQTKLIQNITVNKTTNTVVNKSVNITNIQNVSVLQPIKKVNNLHVTALASLAGGKAGAPATGPIKHQITMERVSKERLAEEKRSAQRIRAIATQRAAAQSKVMKERPAAAKPDVKAPVKVPHNLPKTTPPARVIRHPVKPPPAPPHDRAASHEVKPKAPPTNPANPKSSPPPKEKPKPPPATHEKPKPPPPKEKPKPPPPPKEKPKPPPKEKPKDKGKEAKFAPRGHD
jgi:hypothetical protein